MMCKLFGINKFLFVQKIEFLEEQWVLSIIIQQETQMDKVSILMVRNTRD